MDTEATGDEFVKPCGTVTTATVKRPMNAFLIFCKRHRGLVHEKNPHLDNRSITRILGDLWANLGTDDKSVYTNLAKEYKEAFLKANPNYKWYNPEKHGPASSVASKSLGSPVSTGVMSSSTCTMHSQRAGITPGKLADPSLMGGLSLLLMAGQHTTASNIVSGGTLVENNSLLTVGQQLTQRQFTQLKEANVSRTETELSSPLSPDVPPGGVVLFPVTFSFPTSNYSTAKIPPALPSSTTIRRNLSNASDSPMDLSSRSTESVGNPVRLDCLDEHFNTKSGSLFGVQERQIGVDHKQNGSTGLLLNGSAAFSVSDATSSSTSMLWFISNMLDSHLRTPAGSQCLPVAPPVPSVHGVVNSWMGNLPRVPSEDEKKLSPVSAAPASENIRQDSSAEAGLGDFFPRTKKQLAADHSKPCAHRVFPGGDSDGVKSAETSPSRSTEYSSPHPSTVVGENLMPTLRSLTFAEIQEKLITQVVGSGSLSSLLCDERVAHHGAHQKPTSNNSTWTTLSGSRVAGGDTHVGAAAPCPGGGCGDAFHARKVPDQVPACRSMGILTTASGRLERESSTLTSASLNHSTAASSVPSHQQYRFPKVPLISQHDVHRLIERVISESDPAEFEPVSIVIPPTSHPPSMAAFDSQSESIVSCALSHLASSLCTREPLTEKLQVSCLNTATLPIAPKVESNGKGTGGDAAKQCRDGKIRKRKKVCSSAPAPKIPETLDVKLSNAPDNELFDQSVHNLMHFCTAAIATKPLNLLSTATSVETKCSIPSSEEINNNGSYRHDNGNDVSFPAVTANLSTAAGIRKSNRCNRGRRYNELVSRGALHSARRQNSTSVDCESQAADVSSSDFVADSKSDLMDIAEFSSIPTAVGGRCKRFKSGEFDLEAQIASLPACHIATSDRRPVNRMRSRSHSQTSSKQCSGATADKACSGDLRHWMNICELRLFSKHTDLKQHSVALTNGGTTPGTVSTNGTVPLLTGSCRRKPAKSHVMHLICASAVQSSDVSKPHITFAAPSSLASDAKSGCENPSEPLSSSPASSNVPSTVCCTASSTTVSSTTVSLPAVLPLL